MSTKNSIDLGGLSKQYAARDLPGHLKLKYRDIGQAAPEEVRKDKKELRKELEERERLSGKKDNAKRLSLTEGNESERSKKQRIEPALVNLDADEVLPDSESEEDEDDLKKKNGHGSEDETEDEDEDDDDTEALMAELNKIKQERAAEAARLEAEKKTREEKIRVENILKGNPLLNDNKPSTSDFKVKRRWDDDVVFKNCAKIESDKKQKDFINDTLRSEFHKKFMDRYIK